MQELRIIRKYGVYYIYEGNKFIASCDTFSEVKEEVTLWVEKKKMTISPLLKVYSEYC